MNMQKKYIYIYYKLKIAYRLINNSIQFIQKNILKNIKLKKKE